MVNNNPQMNTQAETLKVSPVNEQANEAPADKVSALTEVEQLMHEVRRLLVHSEGALDEEGISRQAQQLESWLESYRRGLSAAQKLSDNGKDFMESMRGRLALALDELHRLDDEGNGTDAPKEEAKRKEDLTRAIRRIDHLASALDASFKSELCEDAITKV